ncbi:hydrogenase maturation nickel metallochaperone HypA [Collinsella sp. AGMB00827]|uniref:Hydrogenase maturation factor HypA n=1 Tax=Collinsella ureilytica TaxID=2869515 RepID=A0ABS7MJN7_9ACTN|nr:hydrogenase maturation nickel metallochaperone HypA [Collinsella urealyticum]MBY4797492.1 hydrogenase maturation nickel metallochaperone HypA [Collinsella urealyticum]
MHEMGIVDGILATVIAAAHDAGASRIISVRLRIGDMREVVEESLRFAWEALREDDSLTSSAELQVDEVRPKSICSACGITFDHDRFHLRCPACGSTNTRLLAGRELDIVSMEIETDD